MVHRGAKLHLDGGRLVISTKSIVFPREFNYGRNEPFLRVFVLTYVKFLCDSPLELESKRPIRSYTDFLRVLTQLDLRKTIKQFSRLADLILSNEYSTGSDSSTRVFHSELRDTPIFKEYLTWTRTGRPDLIKYVLSFLRFGKKLNYEDDDLSANAFRGWLEVEERLRTLEFTHEDTASLRTIIRELIGPLHIDSLFPRFGPGKVSETSISDVYDKFENLSSSPKLLYAFGRARPGRGADKGFGAFRTITRRGSSEVARVKFVPKDITKARTICMEPNTYMYFQQEVHRWMRLSMDESPIGNFVTIEDQQPNQLAAIHGSKYLCTDTIDLSNASDSVHVELVRRLFPNDWKFFMLATRTSRVVTPDGCVRQVTKFAPMGSAICFPTQCIIFTAVCIYAYIAYARGKTTGSWIVSRDEVIDCLDNLLSRRSASSPFSKRLEAPVVYGDDIAVDSRTTGGVITTLQRLGFQVNVDKSFTGSQSFRESCGVYAYEGEDVTPVIYRVPFFREGEWDAKVYASLIGSVNEFRSHGYNSVASFILSLLKDYGFKYPLPFTTDIDGFGLYTRNKHVPPGSSVRYNANWQCYEQEIQGIGPRKTKKSKPEGFDLYSLDQWWRSRIDGGLYSSYEGRGLSIRPQETRLAPVWARCE